MTICGLTSKCTAQKAAGPLSCLQMKIMSVGMNQNKCDICERFGSSSLGAILSLLR